MNRFTKADLKPNMIVETRNGNMYMIHEFDNELVLIKEDGWLDLLDYTKDLSFYDKVFRRFDIVTVRKPEKTHQLRENDWHKASIIWERKELPELTEDEKVILRNLDVKNVYPWLTRDKNGLLTLRDEKPKKYKNDVVWRNCKEELFTLPYSKLFQFVKWEDDEPCYIPDLLEESE